MIGPIGITLREAEDHFDFLVDLTDRSHVCWKITRPGSSQRDSSCS